MKRIWVIALLALGVALASGDAEAKKKRRSKAHSQAASTSTIGSRDNNTLCNGGVMIIADDQIKGCTALIASRRLGREHRATAYYNRGNAYVGKNDFARAIDDYGQALALRNGYAEALFNRAVAYRISGNPLAAVADYTSALALTPNDADALAGRGMAYVSLAKHERALEDFNRAIALKPGHVGALTQRGHANVRAHLWAPAIADYDAALSIARANIEAYYGRGVAKVYSGDIKGGQVDIASALAGDTGITGRMTTLGIPPPQIIGGETPTPIKREEKPKEVEDGSKTEDPAKP
ncbi:MAG: tetratricopeptide repeat protein [Alphaproteobacteria bacterium]|nr:tetratricopeptide repeat protein [Alphaproteobacteria bacterium]